MESSFEGRPEFVKINFPLLRSNIPLVPAYGVNNSQLVRYARACFKYSRTSMARILMTRFTMAVSNLFLSPQKKSHSCRFGII